MLYTLITLICCILWEVEQLINPVIADPEDEVLCWRSMKHNKISNNLLPAKLQ
jgi:hypothetical protein